MLYNGYIFRKGGALETYFNNDLFNLLKKIFDADKDEFENIYPLKAGMTNVSFVFTLRGEKYIIRFPGEGTDKFINRLQEADCYIAIGNLKISDPTVYFSGYKGYKIVKYIDDVRLCDPYDFEDIEKCFQVLKGLHSKRLSVNHDFDIFYLIEYYEDLRNGAQSKYEDYQEVKKNVLSLKKLIDSYDKEHILCHIDAVPDNFLITDDRIYLIDWEYAGMQDPHLDIAMFIVYSDYSREQADKIIDIYFEGKCSEELRTKIYAYISLAGFLWSNWCEFRELDKSKFARYSDLQYKYAKDYYQLVHERTKK